MWRSSSRWKTTISSMRLRNSGLKWLRTTFMTVRSSAPPPRLLVMISTVFVKSTVRPWPSVRRPSSMHLQQDVEHVGVRLLDLVEQHHRVRPAADGLGELTALVVADVARGRADEARHVVLLLVLRHVDADHRVLVVEQEVGEAARQLGLADARRAEEQERADRAGAGRTGRRATGGWRWRPRSRRRPGRSRARAARPPCARASASSPSISRATGMPVHLATISATSSSSTSSFSMCWSPCSSFRRAVFCSISCSSSRHRARSAAARRARGRPRARPAPPRCGPPRAAP